MWLAETIETTCQSTRCHEVNECPHGWHMLTCINIHGKYGNGIAEAGWGEITAEMSKSPTMEPDCIMGIHKGTQRCHLSLMVQVCSGMFELQLPVALKNTSCRLRLMCTSHFHSRSSTLTPPPTVCGASKQPTSRWVKSAQNQWCLWYSFSRTLVQTSTYHQPINHSAISSNSKLCTSKRGLMMAFAAWESQAKLWAECAMVKRWQECRIIMYHPSPCHGNPNWLIGSDRYVSPYIDGSWIDNQPPQWPWHAMAMMKNSVPLSTKPWSRSHWRTRPSPPHKARHTSPPVRYEGSHKFQVIVRYCYNLLYSYPKNCRYQGVNNLGQHPFSQDWLIWLPEFDPDWTILKLVLGGHCCHGILLLTFSHGSPLQTGNPSP